MLRTVVFHGYLADEYGPEIQLEVSSVGEICRAMEANYRNFYKKIRTGKFHIVLGKNYDKGRSLSEKELTMNIGRDPVHIVPAIAGAGNGGLFQIILGVAMIAAAVVTYGVAGAAYAGAEASLVMGGALMVISGIAQLLTPTPQGYNSYLFNGALNTTTQGGAVPVVYGHTMVGSTIVSSGLSNAQLLDNPEDSLNNGVWWSSQNTSTGIYQINLYANGGSQTALLSPVPILPTGITVSPAPSSGGTYSSSSSGSSGRGASSIFPAGWIPFCWLESKGSNLTLTFTAASGSTIRHIYVDGNDVYDGHSNPFSYTFSNIQASHHLSVAGN